MKNKLKLISCPPEIANISDCGSKDEWWWENDINMATGPADTTQVRTLDLAEVITHNSKNNFARVICLNYFCGGCSKDEEHPTLICTRSTRAWLSDIEARTKGNWDEAGRIELTKQYAFGPAKYLLTSVLTSCGYNWESIKK